MSIRCPVPAEWNNGNEHKGKQAAEVRIAIIGGTGHIGSYLIPMLFDDGHEVTCVCRNQRKPYRENQCWSSITYLTLDRIVEEQAGQFGRKVAAIGAEIVIDLTCYLPESAEQLVDALSGRVSHFLHCGTIWVHGHSISVPTTEDAPRRPFGDYGIRKAAIENWLLGGSQSGKIPATILHPGHIVGPGWAPINPAGNFDTSVFAALKRGDEVYIPNFGMETVHHVHAEDVAQAFVKAIRNRDAAIGQSFHVVSPSALTLRGYAESMAEWFHQPPCLRFLPWEEWKHTVSPRDAALTEDHIRHSPNCSIRKANSLLGYSPRYSSLEAIQESVSWLIQSGSIA
jgi:nucleoside-diphosphate-sugar epimerase